MSTDARISTGLPGHPKTKKLIRRLGAAGGWSLLCLILWARDNRPDGDLSGMTTEDIELAADWTGENDAFVEGLAAVGFIDGHEGAYALHDWAEHQPWSAGSSARSAAARANASKKWGRDLGAENRMKRSERLAEGRKLGTHSAAEWIALRESLGSRCLMCEAADDIVKDHIRPLYLGGSDGIDNLQPLCRSCNARKAGPDSAVDLRPKDWAERLRNALLATGTPAERLPDACRAPAERLQDASQIPKTPAPSPSPSPSPSPNTPLTPQGGKSARKPPRTPAEETEDLAMFEHQFWSAYPKKADKQAAYRAWRKLRVNAELLARMLAGLELWKRHQLWTKDGGRFRHNAATWLNGRLWEDEEVCGSVVSSTTSATPEWCLRAGFECVAEAHNRMCWEHNAHLFRDGRRLPEEVGA